MLITLKLRWGKTALVTPHLVPELLDEHLLLLLLLLPSIHFSLLAWRSDIRVSLFPLSYHKVIFSKVHISEV